MMPPIVLRIAALSGADIGVGLPDLRGLLSDLGVGLLVAAVAGWSARASGWAAVALLLLWALLGYGNYEHVRANAANASVAYAGYLTDRTFVEGSLLRPRSPDLLIPLVVGTAMLGVMAFRRRRRAAFCWRAAGIASLIVIGATLAWPRDVGVLGWRQAHFLQENVRWLLGRSPASAVEPTGGPTPARPFTGDLHGEPWLALGNRGQNLLLIMVEGISGAHLPTLARANGLRFDFGLPNLDRLARENVAYSSFIAQQRQTNRGEYALLCGDYPKLVTEVPKMSQYASGGKMACLPQAMAAIGYETVYLQAAPLAFMMKDQFMSRIGFARIHGEEWFERAYLRQAEQMVERLERGDRPWFLTLLTVGTHHPFTVPASYRAPGEASGFHRAAVYADDALGAFLRAIEAMGIRERTLILITSDESAGIQGGVGDLARIISQSWGVMIAMLPSGEKRLVESPYMQLDLPLSILDYLGVPESAARFAGRSLFRTYGTGRALAFGNTYSRVVGALHPSRHLFLCREDFEHCYKWKIAGGLPFSRMWRRVSEGGIDNSEIDFLREIVSKSRLSPFIPAEGEVYELIAGPRVRVSEDAAERQFIFGGQFLFVPAASRLDVELEFEIEGEEGIVDLHHDLRSAGGQTYFDRAFPGVTPGGGVLLRYSYHTPRPLDGLECRFSLLRRSGRDLALHFRQARLRVTPDPSLADEDDRLQIHHLERK
jgi:hypothetical protein